MRRLDQPILFRMMLPRIGKKLWLFFSGAALVIVLISYMTSKFFLRFLWMVSVLYFGSTLASNV